MSCVFAVYLLSLCVVCCVVFNGVLFAVCRLLLVVCHGCCVLFVVSS